MTANDGKEIIVIFSDMIKVFGHLPLATKSQTAQHHWPLSPLEGFLHDFTWPGCECQNIFQTPAYNQCSYSVQYCGPHCVYLVSDWPVLHSSILDSTSVFWHCKTSVYFQNQCFRIHTENGARFTLAHLSRISRRLKFSAEKSCVSTHGYIVLPNCSSFEEKASHVFFWKWWLGDRLFPHIWLCKAYRHARRDVPVGLLDWYTEHFVYEGEF